ncbi:MAG: hypothetical protein R3F59_16845 [Myxococcota bacterium]
MQWCCRDSWGVLWVALAAGGLAGCGEWPRFSHLDNPPLTPADDVLPVEGALLVEEADWTGDPDWSTDPASAAPVADLSGVTPFEYLAVEGSLTTFGSVVGGDAPVFDCGQDLGPATVTGAYAGDVDFVQVATGGEEWICAYLSVSGPCADAGAEIKVDVIAYQVVGDPSRGCDYLGGSFLTGRSDEDGPAYTRAGSYTKISTEGVSDLLLYVAGVTGCDPNDAVGYELKLVPTRNDARCANLDTKGF